MFTTMLFLVTMFPASTPSAEDLARAALALGRRPACSSPRTDCIITHPTPQVVPTISIRYYQYPAIRTHSRPRILQGFFNRFRAGERGSRGCGR